MLLPTRASPLGRSTPASAKQPPQPPALLVSAHRSHAAVPIPSPAPSTPASRPPPPPCSCNAVAMNPWQIKPSSSGWFISPRMLDPDLKSQTLDEEELFWKGAVTGSRGTRCCSSCASSQPPLPHSSLGTSAELWALLMAPLFLHAGAVAAFPCFSPPALPLTCVGKPRLLNAIRFKAKVSGHVPFGRGGMVELLGKGQPWAAKAGRGLASQSGPVWGGFCADQGGASKGSALPGRYRGRGNEVGMRQDPC